MSLTLLGIYEALATLLPTTGHDWVKSPNDAPLFQGEPPLRLMLEGGLHGLRQVRAMLSADRGPDPPGGLCERGLARRPSLRRPGPGLGRSWGALRQRAPFGRKLRGGLQA